MFRLRDVTHPHGNSCQFLVTILLFYLGFLKIFWHIVYMLSKNVTQEKSERYNRTSVSECHTILYGGAADLPGMTFCSWSGRLWLCGSVQSDEYGIVHSKKLCCLAR